jgi:hypothetical protein
MIKVKTNMRDVVISLNGKISSFLPGAENYDGLLRTVATTMIGVVKTRIHEEGKAADNTSIGVYSTRPLYVSLSASPLKFTARGKNSDATFKVKKSSLTSKKVSSEKVGVLKNGKIRKSGYFEQGYKQFKTEIGRNELGTVNLSLTGQLNAQLTVQPTSRGYGYGWPDEEKLKRAKALERKYKKKVWALTEDETQTVIQISENYVKNALSE